MRGIIMAEGSGEMRRISEWLDRHPKTRIALQLVLDAVPVILVILHLLSGFTVMITDEWGTYSIEPSLFYDVTLICLLVIPIPAFIASFCWRDKAFELLEKYRMCRYSSNVLRIFGALVVSIVLIVDMFLMAAWISI